MLTLTKKDPIPPLIRIREVASLLSVSMQTVRHLIESGDLQASGVSPMSTERHHVRVTRKSLLHFYKQRFGHALTAALANPFES